MRLTQTRPCYHQPSNKRLTITRLHAFAELFGKLGPKWGVDYTLGRRLFTMARAARFDQPEITLNQPAVSQGENKRLLELSVAEAGSAFVKAGLITSDDLAKTLSEMKQLSEDESVVALMPRMTQLSARRPALLRAA